MSTLVLLACLGGFLGTSVKFYHTHMVKIWHHIDLHNSLNVISMLTTEMEHICFMYYFVAVIEMEKTGAWGGTEA